MTRLRARLRFAIAAGLGFCGGLHAAERAPRPAEALFPPGFAAPISVASGRPVAGWGGRWPLATPDPTRASPSRTPVIFVHGNTERATFWEPARQAFHAAGWNDDELWAPSLGHGTTAHFDASDEFAPTLDAFVSAVQRHLSAQAGRPIRQVDIVAHSLGVTAVRQWLTRTNRWHEVRSLVAIAGANHGVWTAHADASGISRASSHELHRGSPWLAALNGDGEIAGATRVLTLYDGSGRYDALFPDDYADSPALAGAVNLAWNREAPSFWDRGLNHRELAQDTAALRAITAFLAAGEEPLPNAEPPAIVRDGDRLHATPDRAALHCRADGRWPSSADSPQRTAAVPAAQWLACYAHDPASRLSSPMQRFRATEPAATTPLPSPTVTLTLTARIAPATADRPWPQLELEASEATALIVLSLASHAPDSGSARYRQPLALPSPVRLRAQAISPDGRHSAVLRIDTEADADANAEPAPAEPPPFPRAAD